MKQKLRQIISVHPHAVLRTQATEVTDFGELLGRKLERMKAVMRGFHGVGIAANQCFMSDSIFIGVISGQERVFINPKVVEIDATILKSEEGCLSIPGIVDTVDRFAGITIEFQNESGEKFTEKFEREAAVIIQHEMDHLNGKLYTDALSELKQDIIDRKMHKFKKAKGLI